jgi:hypothetical protein
MSWRAREVARTSHKNSEKFWVALPHIAGEFVLRGPGNTGFSLCGFDFLHTWKSAQTEICATKARM